MLRLARRQYECVYNCIEASGFFRSYGIRAGMICSEEVSSVCIRFCLDYRRVALFFQQQYRIADRRAGRIAYSDLNGGVARLLRKIIFLEACRARRDHRHEG